MHVTRTAAISGAAALILTVGFSGGAAGADRPAPTPRAAGPASQLLTEAGSRASTGSSSERAAAALLRARAAMEQGTEPVGDVRLMVKSTAGAQSTVRSAAARYGTASKAPDALAQLGYVAVTVPAASAGAAAAALRARADVVSVSQSRKTERHYTPTDPKYSSWQSIPMGAMQAPTAWDVAKGSGVKIAVVDSGFSVTHPDLAGRTAGNWDVYDGDAGVGDGAGDPQPGHGTATASAAGAATGNGIGIAGAAPSATLMLIKTGDYYGDVYTDYLAAGIAYAGSHGADIISVSLGSSYDEPVVADAVASAQAAGAVVVAAAGNDGVDVLDYPGAYDGVIAVGATNASGSARATWSTYGDWVDVAAPGTDIAVAVPAAADDDGTVDGYTRWDGTSFAAPLVAGGLAVIQSARPGATDGERVAALLGSTKALTGGGFAGGLVQWRSAISLLDARSSTTTLTVPAGGDTVSGEITVSAGSDAPAVKFGIAGTTISRTATVSAGVATTTLPTWGVSGAETITAVGCVNAQCDDTSSDAAVTVTNAAPVITAPSTGSFVGATFQATATAAGGSVRFLADGSTSLGSATVSPYTTTLNTLGLANDNSYLLSAVTCNGDGTTCDVDNPSDAVLITVNRLTTSAAVSGSPFSPNGDGRRDTATLTYSLDRTGDATVRVLNQAGSVVRSATLATGRSAGTYTWVWNGKSNTGRVVADGLYKIQVRTAANVGGTILDGLAVASVRVDKARPGGTSISASPSTFFPVSDGYKDTTALKVTSSEALSALTVSIYNSSGTRVRTISVASRPAGALTMTWNGRSNSGSLVAAGGYTFAFTLQDVAGNRSTTSRYSVSVSSKKLVAKTGTKTVTATGSFRLNFSGECSGVYTGARAAWSNDLGYYSLYEYWYGAGCYYDTYADSVAGAMHSYTLPSAIRYGSIKVGAYGGRADADFPDTARLYYLDKAEDISSTSKTLGSTTGYYSGPAVGPSNYLDGRTFRWIVYTDDGSWYDVKYYKVTWTYYVLG